MRAVARDRRREDGSDGGTWEEERGGGMGEARSVVVKCLALRPLPQPPPCHGLSEPLALTPFRLQVCACFTNFKNLSLTFGLTTPCGACRCAPCSPGPVVVTCQITEEEEEEALESHVSLWRYLGERPVADLERRHQAMLAGATAPSLPACNCMLPDVAIRALISMHMPASTRAGSEFLRR